MKIAIYALHLGFGGVEKYVVTIANMLSECHDVEIVSTYKIQEKPAFALSERVKVRYLLGDLKPNRQELQNCIKQKKFLLLFREIYRALKILYLKKFRNIQALKEEHSDIIISTRIFHNQLIGKYADKQCIKITGEHNHHNYNQKYIQSVISSCKGFDYFIPISKELCDFYEKPMKEMGIETRYIRFCIDKVETYKTPCFEKMDLVSVGRLSSEKGTEDLLRVFETVNQENDKAILHIVGDGPDYNKIVSLIKEKKLENKVYMHGFQDKQYIYSLLKKTSVYVMTSFTESFGIVLLEAMACGIPCIAFDSAQGAHEIIENGVNGYLIEERSVDKMKRQICNLLNDRNELIRLSQGAYQTARKFSYENTKKTWLDLMCEIESKRNKI